MSNPDAVRDPRAQIFSTWPVRFRRDGRWLIVNMDGRFEKNSRVCERRLFLRSAAAAAKPHSARRRIMRTTVFIVLAACFGVGAYTAPQDPVDVEGIRVEADPNDPDRFLVFVDTVIEDLPGQIDKQMGGRLGVSCSRNVYWDGQTRIRSGGSSIQLSTRIRYEHWVCAILKTRLFRKTFDVEWTIRVNEPARLENLVFTAQLRNIRGVPGELEQWFNLQERIRRDVRIPIPADCGRCQCSSLIEDLTPIAEQFEFEVRDGVDIVVKGVFSASSDLSGVVQCLQ